jgi:hypothetical protein
LRKTKKKERNPGVVVWWSGSSGRIPVSKVQGPEFKHQYCKKKGRKEGKKEGRKEGRKEERRPYGGNRSPQLHI